MKQNQISKYNFKGNVTCRIWLVLINKEKLSKSLKSVSGIKENKQNIPVYNSIQVIVLEPKIFINFPQNRYFSTTEELWFIIIG